MMDARDSPEQQPPFWLPTTPTLRHRRSSAFLSSGVLITALSVTAIVFVFFVIPPILSFTSQFIRPNLVKKSWNTLNLVLVLFAILCGILGRRPNDDDDAENNNTNFTTTNNTSSTSTGSYSNGGSREDHQHHQWYHYPDRTVYDRSDGVGVGVGGLKRSSSSYPDLIKQEPLWDRHNWRFFDDQSVYASNYRSEYSAYPRHRRNKTESDAEDRIIPGVNRESLAPPQPPPPPPLPPPPPPPPPQKVELEVKQRFESIAKEERNSTNNEEGNGGILEGEKLKLKLKQPPPPPPPPPPRREPQSETRSGRSDRKRSGGGAAKEIASTLASLYNQSKRKKKKQRHQRNSSKDNFDDFGINFLHRDASPLPPSPAPPPSTTPPPPPPPPPPPSSSVFHNLFKIGKSKRIHSLAPSTAPPPPPPPPPPQTRKPSAAQRGDYGRPPLPMMINNGNQSPIVPIPMPPPPPPPPFRVPAMKFVVRGDYVRIMSAASSRTGSPEPEDSANSTPTSTPTSTAAIGGSGMDGGDLGMPALFCPSPDVNTKADAFIERLRAGWRLEKVNSIKAKQQITG